MFIFPVKIAYLEGTPLKDTPLEFKDMSWDCHWYCHQLACCGYEGIGLVLCCFSSYCCRWCHLFQDKINPEFKRTIFQSGIDRRKFRSQTSDYMDRWKAEQGRGREKRKSRREMIRRERVRRKKMQMREKVGKSRNTMFFQWFVAPEDRKVGSLKRRVRRQLARWEMKNCTPLWREAHFQVKMHKTPQERTTFGS